LKPPKNALRIAEELSQQLSEFRNDLDSADLRTKVRQLIPLFHTIRDLGSSLLPGGNKAARSRILEYFKRYPRTVLDGDEIMVISGISDWPRRVRELRVQFGWWIYSGVTFRQIVEDSEAEGGIAADLDIDVSKIKPDQYVLVREEEDRDAAFRWRVLNEIRREKWAVKKKLIEYLRRNVGKPVTGEELRYLANDKKEWPRRTRELRTEDGWPVATRMSGRPDLPVGVYILEEDRQAEPHDRKIPDDVRVAVLTRDGFRCTECGWNRDMISPGDPRKLLELHHIHHHKDKGTNDKENLITLCNVCHDKLHRELKR